MGRRSKVENEKMLTKLRNRFKKVYPKTKFEGLVDKPIPKQIQMLEGALERHVKLKEDIRDRGSIYLKNRLMENHNFQITSELEEALDAQSEAVRRDLLARVLIPLRRKVDLKWADEAGLEYFGADAAGKQGDALVNQLMKDVHIKQVVEEETKKEKKAEKENERQAYLEKAISLLAKEAKAHDIEPFDFEKPKQVNTTSPEYKKLQKAVYKYRKIDLLDVDGWTWSIACNYGDHLNAITKLLKTKRPRKLVSFLDKHTNFGDKDVKKVLKRAEEEV